MIDKMSIIMKPKRKIKNIVLCATLFLLPSMVHAQEILNLRGAWDLSLGDSTHYNDYVMLPGSLLTNGKGNPVSIKTQWTGSLYDSSFYFNPYMEKYRHEGQMKFPFFLTPERHFVGTAWYRKRFYVPKDWDDRRVTLFMERVHIESRVFVNGHEVGSWMSLSTPHRYEVTEFIKAGKSNEIAVCVYNGIENVCVGQDSHSVTDQTQGNWNGIIGRVELQARWKKISIDSVRVIPDAARKEVHVELTLEKHFQWMAETNFAAMAEVCYLNGEHAGRTLAYANNPVFRRKMTLTISLKNFFRQWDEFYPYLYLLKLRVGDDYYETTFGMRDISIIGRQMYINRRPLFLRGTVENCCFPETGYPPTDIDSWLSIFRKCKEYGLNHMRFHSYCPPDAAFTAADEMGVYLQVEGPTWPNHGVKLRRGMKIDQYLIDESRRIIDEYGHHPSFLMMAAGNEPAGDWVAYCNDWVRQMHDYDSTKVYCGASVGGGWAWDSASEYHVKGGARGLDEWNSRPPSSDDDYSHGILFPRNYKDTIPNNTPIITHEQGQWCAFPDFKEIPQYTGAYKAANFEIFRDLLHDNGMESMAEKFLMASGHLQTLCYKYEIERNLRTPDYAGFQLLSLNDYSGQGTALVGPLNVHWKEKGYVSASDWHEFCSILVPLARFPKFVYSNRDTLRVPVELYNAYSMPITNAHASYYLADDSAQVITGGLLTSDDLPVGKNFRLGTVVFPLDSITRPQKLTLHVRFSNLWKNHWDFWVYPADAPAADESGVFVTSDYQKALMRLRSGATVLLTAAGKVTLGSDVKQSYLPVFWNTSWFKMRPPHTTGAYIDKSHPLFKHDFPTDDWANLNWWELLNKAQVINLMEFPHDYQPPIQPIDTWHVSRKLGMLIEAKVGKGRLLMTTMDITTSLETRLVARQMRHAILSYMKSSDFQPTLTLAPQTITNLFTRQAPPVNMFTVESPDELKPQLQPFLPLSRQ